MAKAPASPIPYAPVPWTDADALSIKALRNGEASPAQQIRAIEWIIGKAAGKDEFHYYPSERDTIFALGRAFVGQQIVKMIHLDMQKLKRATHVEE
jgi:hypothetical protein